MSKKLYLLDGSALVYRAFFALRQTGLTNAEGEPTSAVFGFANTLQLIVASEKPDYLAVVFDPPGPTFRHEIYTEYKATRSAMPDELRIQMPWVKELVAAWPCALLEVPGMEADDVIGAYAAQLGGPDLDVVVVTGDKDFYQLLGRHVSILNPGRGGTAAVESKLLGPDDVPQKFGVTEPAQVVDVLALMGDSSDNVPGVPGVGPKTAGKLIAEYGSIEELYAHLDDLRPALREKLETHRDLVAKSRELVTIRTELELPAPIEDLVARPPGGSELIRFLDRMNLEKLRRDLGLDAEPEVAPGLFARQDSYRLVSDESSLRQLADRLGQAEQGLAVSTVTDTTNPMRATLLGIALAAAPGEAYYVNLGHGTGGEPLPLALVREHLGPVLADSDVSKVAHDAKSHFLVLERAGLPVSGFVFDTMIASYLVDPESSHQLDKLVATLLGETMIPAADLVGKGAKRRPMAEVEAQAAMRYGAESADMAQRLRHVFAPKIERMGLEPLFKDVEIPLLWVLLKMERTGVALDIEFLKSMKQRLDEELGRLESQAHELAGKVFNPNSSQQLAEVLFQDLGLPRGRRTKTGYSTDSEVLEKLSPAHPLPGVLLEYRQLSKLKSTYVDTLPEMIHPDTGRVHGSFNQTVAATGRLSSSDPNLQNIPIRTPLGKEVRKAFVPGEPGWVLVSADYSQIELRIMAHLSGDPALCQAFAAGVDVHRDTASRIFGVAAEDVSDAQRAQAKTVNFGVLYGQGPYGLARTLGISTDDAAAFIRNYKNQYAGVTRFLETTLTEAKRSGYVTTLLNRRRFLPGLRAQSAAQRAASERLAINTPIQGSAADLIKVAMVELDRRLAEEVFHARLLLQVHDELVLECPREEAPALGELVTTIMEEALELRVPVVVNVGTGMNWAEIH